MFTIGLPGQMSKMSIEHLTELLSSIEHLRQGGYKLVGIFFFRVSQLDIAESIRLVWKSCLSFRPPFQGLLVDPTKWHGTALGRIGTTIIALKRRSHSKKTSRTTCPGCSEQVPFIVFKPAMQSARGGIYMSQYVVDASVINGYLELKNMPFEDNMQVKVVVIPKADLSRMSFPNIWKKSEHVRQNVSQDISRERDER